MSHKLGKKRITVFLCVMLAMVCSASVRALAADKKATAKLKLYQEVSGLQKTDESFTYQLEAQEDNIPVPEQKVITGNGAGEVFFEVEYRETGIYRYTLRQIAGNAANWSYDDSVYQVEVYVLRGEDTDELETLVIYYDKDGNKAEAVFHNSYHTPQIEQGKPDAVKTGDTATRGLWLTAMAAAVGVAAVIFRKNKE